MINYPSFPTLTGGANGIPYFIIEVIIWVIEIPIIAFANFLITVAGGAGTGASSSINTVLGFLGKVFQNSLSAFQGFGIFAPIVGAVVWGVALVAIVFFVFKAVQVATAETTEDV